MDLSLFGKAILLSLIAGLATGVGSVMSLFIDTYHKKYLSFALGFSAGVMVYISLVEILPESIASIGFLPANAAFFIGFILLATIDFLIPHHYIEEAFILDEEKRKMYGVGVLVAVGIAIHNLPEGMAVATTALGDMSLAIPLMVAIAIHNIPEGISIAMPIYYATHNRERAFWFSFLSGFAEPLGAIIGCALVYVVSIDLFVSYFLAGVAGLMVFISFDELLPLCFEHKKGHSAILGLLTGMFVMALSLYLL